jgi:hypothetical protein
MRLDYGAVLVDGFDHLLDGSVPLEHPLLLGILRSEAFYLPKVALQEELFVVVAIPGLGAGDVLCEKRSHKINLSALSAYRDNEYILNLPEINGREAPGQAWEGLDPALHLR